MDQCHVVLEIHRVTENNPLSLTERMGADDELLYWELA